LQGASTSVQDALPPQDVSADVLLSVAVLGGLAEFERELIKIRTGEGRELAKKNGVSMGRKPLLSPYQIAEVRQRKANGESVRQLARSYRVSPNTISRVR
jgi:DNA invertase Pin-like site-specific DNA recombinase